MTEEKFKIFESFTRGVRIGQAARQGPIARPTKSSARPSSFNKWDELELFKKSINLIRSGLGL